MGEINQTLQFRFMLIVIMACNNQNVSVIQGGVIDGRFKSKIGIEIWDDAYYWNNN